MNLIPVWRLYVMIFVVGIHGEPQKVQEQHIYQTYKECHDTGLRVISLQNSKVPEFSHYANYNSFNCIPSYAYPN